MYKDNPDILLLESYTRSKDKIKCRCKKCGHEWSSCASNILSEHIRCPVCSSSKSEDQLAGILTSLNLNYERKVRFKECRYKKPLEFDFIIYDNNKNITLLVNMMESSITCQFNIHQSKQQNHIL